MATIGFIGGGNMARCLISGVLRTGYVPQHIWVSNPHHNEHLAYFQQLGVQTTLDNKLVAEKAELLVLAVKPQVLPEVARSLEILKQSCVLSIAAGIRLQSLQAWLGNVVPIVRAMPNTPALIGYGATGLYTHQALKPEHKQLITSLFESVGIAIWLEQESQLDIVTALSGSGPAYFFLVLEALIQAAMEQGLPAKIAEQLALQTAMGAAHLASSSTDSVANLRAKVTSPGGTTEAAIQALETGELRVLFANAIQAAQQRAKTLGDKYVVSDSDSI